MSPENVLKAALANLPEGPSQAEVDNMKELVVAIKDACTELADSKPELHFLNEIPGFQNSIWQGHCSEYS